MLTHDYARFAAQVHHMPIPPEVLHHAKRCLVDWFAATLPGGMLPPATLMTDALVAKHGTGEASLLPSGIRTDARTAALINGSASHTVEFDDIFRDGLYHPGAPVISAALAVAETSGASGDLLLRGVIAGYEISNRVARVMVPAHYEFWHTTGTVGFFGAAAAAATVLGLDETQTAHAIAGVGSMAAGLQQALRGEAMTKPLHAGRAAEGGVLSAQIAQAGVTSVLDMLEGNWGFGKAMSRDADWSHAADGLGSDWTITQITQKNHAACGHVHAAVDAVIALAREHGLTADNVAAIRVGSYQKAKEICGNPEPTSTFEAKFSMPYCLAAALVWGKVRTAAFEPLALADRIVRDVIFRVTHTVDDECEGSFPNQRSAKVEIDTTDGRTVSHFSPTRKGDPDHPLSDEELNEKYAELAAPVIGPTAAAALAERLWAVEHLATVNMLELQQLRPLGTG